ncbi:MAG: hypothetical protein IT245_00810 [Bacteroidia bacterium]|nr:hypothetical protein [Bacteroidia bacterium]
MRKLIVIAAIFTGLTLQAQMTPVLKNRRGLAILPEQKDFCLGLGANPFFNYFGNMFNGSVVNSSPIATFANNNGMIFGKYMKTSAMAYRGGFRLGLNRDVTSVVVKDMTPGAPVDGVVSDLQKRSSVFIGLSFGIEKRKGNASRIQGFYGYEGIITYNSGSNTKYEYGNQLENLDTGLIRVKKLKSSSLFSIGLRGFAGVEYFIAPKFSIGAELGYGPNIGFRSTAEQITEQRDFSGATNITETQVLSPKSTIFSIDTDNYNGIIKLLFYF